MSDMGAWYGSRIRAEDRLEAPGGAEDVRFGSILTRSYLLQNLGYSKPRDFCCAVIACCQQIHGAVSHFCLLPQQRLLGYQYSQLLCFSSMMELTSEYRASPAGESCSSQCDVT